MAKPEEPHVPRSARLEVLLSFQELLRSAQDFCSVRGIRRPYLDRETAGARRCLRECPPDGQRAVAELGRVTERRRSGHVALDRSLEPINRQPLDGAKANRRPGARRTAQKHRAASQALADAEARACSGISDEDRDMSPFNHPEDIQSVSPVRKEIRVEEDSFVTREIGVTIVFRAVQGMTAEWLQRVVDCHLARAAAVGHAMPEMSYCPLVPKGVEAKVTSAGNGFAVNISAADQATIDEIKRRAQALLAR
jgi:hypothetical protein